MTSFASALALTAGCSAPPRSAPVAEAGTTDLADAVASEAGNEDGLFDAASDNDETTPAADALDALEVIPGAFVEENMPLRLLLGEDTIDLNRAPQGGHVVMIAAQIRRAATTAANIRVRVRRPDTGFIVAEEKRTVAMVPVPGEDATLQPDLRSRSQVAHVPLCPDYDAIDIVGRPLDVEIEVTTLYTDPPRVGVARLTLVPACRQSTPEEQALCRCECEANYALGKCTGDARAP